LAVFTLALLSPKIIKLLSPADAPKEEFKISEVILAPPPPIDPEVTPPPPPPPVEPPKIASTKFLPPVILEDEKVQEEEEPPTQKELEVSNPGEVTQEGNTENLNEVIVAAKVENNEILVHVAEPATFQGDYYGFLRKNMVYPSKAVDDNIQGKVYLEFTVEKDGSITDLKVIKPLGHGCDEEAMRVIRMTSGKWSIPKNNGVAVRYKKSLAVVFQLARTE